jgi:hypothetical protein
MQTANLETMMDQANALPACDDRITSQREILQFEADDLAKIWTTIVQAIVAVVLAVGGYFTYRNLRVAQENLEETKRKATADREASEANLRATNERLDIDREAQITNRFTQAIGQLGAELKNGDPNLEVRLGGIYALERIAYDSLRDHWTIMEILTGYVRENARWPQHSLPPDGAASSSQDLLREPPKPRADVQAILTVVGRRLRAPDRLEPDPLRAGARQGDRPRGLNLSVTDLRGADLRSAHLEWANLRDVHLEGANLRNTHLEAAGLRGAHLDRANFDRTHLDGARLEDANLTTTLNLNEGQLKRAESWQGALLPRSLAHLKYHTEDKPLDFSPTPSSAPRAANTL